MNRKHKRHGVKVVTAKATEKVPEQAVADADADALTQEFQAPEDDIAPDMALLVLHIVRVVALYIYVLLSEQAVAVDRLFQSADEGLTETHQQLEQQLCATLLSCVRDEMDSNQFDGLVQEKRVFAVLKQIFRHKRMRAHMQCRVLLRVLAQYLKQLQRTPIVQCEHASVLASTLEYIARDSKSTAMSPSLLYPLVNVVDSLSIEQRECLDALTILWNWLGNCDPTGMIVESLVRLHHTAVFSLGNTQQQACLASDTSKRSMNRYADLAMCFVRTLILNSDHIFRRDVGWNNTYTLWDSDDEDSPTDPSKEKASLSQRFDPAMEVKPDGTSKKQQTSLLPPLTKQPCVPEPSTDVIKEKGDSFGPAAVCMGLVAAAVATLWRIFT